MISFLSITKDCKNMYTFAPPPPPPHTHTHKKEMFQDNVLKVPRYGPFRVLKNGHFAPHVIKDMK